MFVLIITVETANACITSSNCPTNAFCEHNILPSEFGQCICQEGFFIVEENKIKKCHKGACDLILIFSDFCAYKWIKLMIKRQVGF